MLRAGGSVHGCLFLGQLPSLPRRRGGCQGARERLQAPYTPLGMMGIRVPGANGLLGAIADRHL
jgi:hypothetical protein